MARHLMAVCVVCLLCAEHLPCKEHILDTGEKLSKSLNFPRPQNDFSEGAQYTNPLNADKDYNYVFDKKKEKTKVSSRVKRHTHDEHHHHPVEIFDLTKYYIGKLFEEFGANDTMNIYGFEKILRKLNLNKLETEYSEKSKKSSDSENCVNGLEFILKITDQKSTKLNEYKQVMGYEEFEKHDHEHHHHHEHETEHKASINITQLLDEVKKTLLIEKSDMKSICPILLYHITAATSLEQEGCLDKENFAKLASYQSRDVIEMEDRGLVWLYSTLAIIGVSLCGLLGVAVIPIMEKHFYHHVVQFLVALAVGTLCGDALLHLIPHAMMTSINSPDMHESMMYKGLAAVCGIVVFYFFERFLTIVTEWRQRKQKRDNPSSRVRVMRDPENTSLNNGLSGEKQCKHKYSSYPYCYDEIAMDTKDDHHEHNHVEKLEGSMNHSGHSHCSHKRTNSGKCLEHGDSVTTPDIAQNLVKKTQNGAVDICNFNKNSFNSDTDNNTVSTNLEDGSIESNMCGSNNQANAAATKPLMQEENYTIILREHESKHHGHSHTHGHVHSPPENLSAVVWMVIMGDGLHNFTDGMAIGAAFSNNIAGGLSTAVAVFCHELPHELGDFAVLLKAGMSAKQAVYYNILSSILSFFGMVVGILIGDTPEASAWVFSIAAGLFIYIALVDMMPELTSSHGKEESCMLNQCFLQFLGMVCGFGTMWLIAVYEHDLKMMFTS